MKRYLVFYYLNYYPNGGIEDFKGDFDNLEVAKVHLKISAKLQGDEEFIITSGHIYDCEEKKIILDESDFG